MLWAFLLVSAAIVITLPTKMAIQALGTSFILRMIVSLGPEFTLTVLALALVSRTYLSILSKLARISFNGELNLLKNHPGVLNEIASSNFKMK